MKRGLFFRLLKDHSKGQALKIFAAAIASGFMQSLTILVVSFALDDIKAGDVSIRYFLLFLLSVGAYFVCYRYAVGHSTTVALRVVSSLQMQLTNALKKLPLRNFEQLDEGQVYNEIIGNKDIIVEAARFVVMAVSGSSLMVVAFAFSLYLSVSGFLVILLTLVFGILFLSLVQVDVMRLQQKAQSLDERFIRCLKDVIFGFTELKMNKAKQDELFEVEVVSRAAECTKIKQQSEQSLVRGLAFFSSFVFFPVAAIVFILPGFIELSFEDTVKLIGITLFSLGPLSSIVMALPVLSKAEMMLINVKKFQETLEQMGETLSSDPVVPLDFQRLELRNCKFHYKSEDGLPQFSLDIDQFHLDKNEIVFLTGGNGSGKTSLMKVLAGLYPPDSGEITIDNRSIDDVGLANYRSSFSMVLMNFHLFEKLYGVVPVDTAYCQELLKDMLLDDKISLVDGCRFSSTEVSSGQRKRLAVVAACLEKKDILLFDEVAADFDPIFRKFFYEEFIPKLRQSGKTILAISHDDRYYHIADRVVTMRYGEIDSTIMS